jgi:hypothetical protein
MVLVLPTDGQLSLLPPHAAIKATANNTAIKILIFFILKIIYKIKAKDSNSEINFLQSELLRLGKLPFIKNYKTEYPILTHFIISTLELQNPLKAKLPNFSNANCLIDKRSFEQCTSESIANFKASLFSNNNLLILGAGIGIDEIAFSKSFKQIVSVEPNNELNFISKLNFNNLYINNITRIDDTAENFLNQNKQFFDCIYTDPDRRDEKGRQILLKEHQPNIPSLLEEISKNTNCLIIKCSPLYDFEMALNEIPNITDFYAIGLKGEVKEMLIVSNMESKNEQYNIHCVDILNNETIHQFSIKSELYKQETITTEASLTETYFYEAGNTMVKMRCFKHSANQLDLKHIDVTLPYYCSNQLHPDYVGRFFQLKSVFAFNSKSFKNYLNQNEIQQINLKIRGLNFKTNELLKSMKLKEGGDDYFFILPHKGNKMVFHCLKTND